MMQNEENKTSDLKKIPGVGANMEQHLKNIGIYSRLKGKRPRRIASSGLYEKGIPG